jgi:hypothetical protein
MNIIELFTQVKTIFWKIRSVSYTAVPLF